MRGSPFSKNSGGGEPNGESSTDATRMQFGITLLRSRFG